MQLPEQIARLRALAISRGEAPVPSTLQGVSKARIQAILERLDLSTTDQIDVVFALLDNEQASWFPSLPDFFTFSNGASIAHIGCHVGILQRGKSKLDREGRDYWIKPLRDIGAIEAVYADSKAQTFLPGHPVAKSPNSAYRLSTGFVDILRAPGDGWHLLLDAWSHNEVKVERLRFQAEQAKATRETTTTAHLDLIEACCKHYAPAFLHGYRVVYVDDADGDRVSETEASLLAEAGLEIILEDAMPDVLLWNPQNDGLWVIEAVTSDGEVDQHKVDRMLAFAARYKKESIHFTTAYPTWKIAAQRQGSQKNIPPGTYIWILEDASKHFLAESFRH